MVQINTFVKQIMLIGSGDNSIQTELASGINMEFDMDELTGTISFSLPYYKVSTESGVLDLTKFKKGDTIQLYYNTFESDPGPDVALSDLKLVFDGVLNTINKPKSKDSRIQSMTGLGTLGIGNDRTLERKTNEVSGPVNAVNTILQLAGLQAGDVATTENIAVNDIFPVSKIRVFDTDVENLFIKLAGGNSMMEELKNITKKYAIKITQSGDGYINIITPSMLLSRPEGLNIQAWEFRTDENVWEVDFGEVNNNINCVVVLGRPPIVGYAVDPIGVQLAAGSGVTPGPQHYRYLSIERRDIVSEEDAEKVAKNELLNILKNYTISFKTLYNPDFMVGQALTLYDDDEYPDGAIFFIKKFSVTIDKSDVSCAIEAFANSLTLFPEDIVIESTGIADVDVLDVQYDVQDILGVDNFG